MTTPKIETFSSNGSRWYVHPKTQKQAIGVTSALAVLNKPALMPWAAKMAATFAVTNKDLWIDMDPQDAINLIKGASKRDSGKKASAGSEVHRLVEQFWAGEKPVIAPEAQPYLRSFLKFVQETMGYPAFVEETVWSDRHNYAGSFDAIYNFPPSDIFPDGIPAAVVDVKTGSGIYSEVAMQQTAYARADYILRPDGSQIALPPITHGFALHLRPEGYSLIPVDMSDETFDAFKACVKLLTWQNMTGATAIGAPVNANPIRKLSAVPN